MTKLFVSVVVGWLALSAAVPAMSGPDFDAIARDRKARDAAVQASPASQSHGAAPTTPDCQPSELVPQLDHGPQAQTTPYLNRQRVERRDAALQECKNRMQSKGAE